MNCCDTYCSNYGCNQGRDCPVRIQAAKAAEVAKVGRKHLGPQALPRNAWRHHLRTAAKCMLVGWCLAAVAAFLTSVV